MRNATLAAAGMASHTGNHSFAWAQAVQIPEPDYKLDIDEMEWELHRRRRFGLRLTTRKFPGRCCM